jgi:polyhydroxyalkanoate synthesis regulator phasin
VAGERRKQSRGNRKTAAARRRPRDVAPDVVGEALRRVLAPLDAVVLSRARLQEALDDAVERGRMTRDDASDLVAELVRRGRRQTDDLLRDLGEVVTLPAERVRREVDRARRVTGLAPGFPIVGYDDLTAAEVKDRLGDLSPVELRAVRDYEKRNANRKSVLAAVERRLP